jgi:hypothetical protein
VFSRNSLPIPAQYICERPELSSRGEKSKKARQQTKGKLKMRKLSINKRSLVIMLCVVAFTIASALSASAAPTPVPVTITAVYNFSTFPNVTGTFTTSGALTVSGTSTMHVELNVNGIRAHCVVTLIPSDGSGTIIIDQQCQFATSMPAPYPDGQGKGRWEIVGGTGAYANLNGNGKLTMPGTEEAMTGFIYQ